MHTKDTSLQPTLPVLPDTVRKLITRKLYHLKQDHQKLLASTLSTLRSNMYAEIKKDITEHRLAKACTLTPIKTYEEIVLVVVEFTKKWPILVWDTIESVLLKTKDIHFNDEDITKLMDESTWLIGEPPFTLTTLEPKRFLEQLSISNRRFMEVSSKNQEMLEKNLALSAAIARTHVVNTGRQTRDKANIAIEEFLLEHGTAIAIPITDPQKEYDTSDCLPFTPKRKDDWFSAIRDMTVEFFNQYKRCPTEIEAWTRLHNSPPELYCITSIKNKNRSVIIMDGKEMDKQSFYERWQRYTTPK